MKRGKKSFVDNGIRFAMKGMGAPKAEKKQPKPEAPQQGSATQAYNGVVTRQHEREAPKPQADAARDEFLDALNATQRGLNALNAEHSHVVRELAEARAEVAAMDACAIKWQEEYAKEFDRSAKLLSALKQIANTPCSYDHSAMSIWLDDVEATAREAIREFEEVK
jgi:septal ring factor EnvC (AmiA/AmiB activator)